MGDRSGGREVKGASLKKSKKNPGSTISKAKKAPKSAGEGATNSAPAPPPSDLSGPFFDCGCAIISRQFDRDRDRVLARSKEAGLSAVVQWFSDVEKQQQMLDLSKANSGFLYLVAGVHPDNVDRTNKKSHDSWLEKVEEIGKRGECVGILTGLNLVRETGTHFAQESLLASACKLADKLQLPLVLHVASDGASLERALEVLRGEGWTKDASELLPEATSRRFMIHDAVSACAGDAQRLQLAVRAGATCMVSAAGLADGDAAARDKGLACIAAIPLDQMVIGSDSPWHTPQNLEDAYLRTLRNEPSNLPATLAALAEALQGVPRDELIAGLKLNAMQFFGLEALSSEQLANADAAAALGAAADGGNKADGGGKMPAYPSSSSSSASTSTSSSSPTSSSCFSCQRCRLKLFSPTDVTVHGLDAARSSVFKVGAEVGLCTASIFVAASDPNELATRTGLQIRGGNVECSECGSKLGRFSLAEAICSCGAAVPGPTAKITAVKVDYVDADADAETLALRSIKEAEEREMEGDLDTPLVEGGKKKKKKAAKMKSENKGNFSSFRNKSFIPGMSRRGKKSEEEEKEEEEEEEGAGEDDDEEEEEEEEEKKALHLKVGRKQKQKHFVPESDSSSDEDGDTST